MTDALSDVAGKIVALPEARFLKAVEVLDQISDKAAIETLFDELRPRLRRLRPSRNLTLKRLLCRPFEDLLSGTDTKDHRDGRIPRRQIDRLWGLLLRREGPRLRSLQAELKVIPRRDLDRIAELGERVWRIGAASLGNELPIVSEAPELFALIRNALASASEIEAFKQAVPAKPILVFDRAVGAEVENALARLVEKRRPIDALLFVVAARLRFPLHLMTFLNGADVAIPPALAARLGALALDDIADQAEELRRAGGSVGPETVALEADRLVRAIVDAENVPVGASRTSKLQKTRDAFEHVRGVLQSTVFDPAPAALDRALEPAADQDDVIAAEALARAVRRGQYAAEAVGLTSLATETAAVINARLHERIDQLFAAVAQVPPLPDQSRRRCVADLYRAIRMIELTRGPEAALPFLERARAVN